MTEERRGDGAPPRSPNGEEGAPLEPPLGAEAGPAEHESVPRRPGRRRSPLLAAVVVVACAWLLREAWPDAAYFFSPATPIDLGSSLAYRPERARPNRLVRVEGAPVASVSATAATGEARLMVALAGTNVILDRPAGAVAAAPCEGRLLPPAKAAGYGSVAAELSRRGFQPSVPWVVVREGERPHQRWSRPLLALAVVALGALNLWALMRRIALRRGAGRAHGLQ